MNRKAMIESICDYVLSQDHERENDIENLVDDLKSGMTAKELYGMRENRIYYCACVLLYGKREANKMYRECIQEAMK
jgi:hypothetical protein